MYATRSFSRPLNDGIIILCALFTSPVQVLTEASMASKYLCEAVSQPISSLSIAAGRTKWPTLSGCQKLESLKAAFISVPSKLETLDQHFTILI